LILTQKSLALVARELAARDPTLAGIHAVHGDPPLWRRATGFQTLVHIILEQQVSLKSAQAMLVRLETAIQPFTRQKSAYVLHLANSIVNGDLSFTRLARMNDDEARLVLTRVKGIGLWSADVYLLMAMRRADIWPAGDLALAVAMQELKGLESRPRPEELEKLAEIWRPHRAVAARMLWQYYLGKRGSFTQRHKGRHEGTKKNLTVPLSLPLCLCVCLCAFV
jgi:DNA-3-methyladenine glycosylase II